MRKQYFFGIIKKTKIILAVAHKERKKNKRAKHTYFLLRCQIPAGFPIHSLTVSIQSIIETMSEIPSSMDCSSTFKCDANLTI